MRSILIEICIKLRLKVWIVFLQIYEKFLPCTQPNSTTPIPVYQRPMELYQEPMLKRKSQGVDFNNLILLTKNSIKMRRGHSKPIVQQPFLLDSRQSLKTSSHNVQVQWFDKDHCAKKTKEVVTVNTLVSELRSFEEKYEYCRGAGTSWKTTVESPQRQQRSSETSFRLKDKIFGNESSRYRSKNRFFENESSRYRISDVEEKNERMKRPLYRDVLANASNETALDNVFEKRYVKISPKDLNFKTSVDVIIIFLIRFTRVLIFQIRRARTSSNRTIQELGRIASAQISGNDLNLNINFMTTYSSQRKVNRKELVKIYESDYTDFSILEIGLNANYCDFFLLQ